MARIRDFEALEQRRCEAATLLRQGVRPAEVARRLGVTRQSVSRWAKTLAEHGRRGLRRAGRAGRPPQLTAADLRRVERALKAGPEAHGYATGLWTLARVAKLIETTCGVQFGETRVWQLLCALGWSCQRPTGQARERDEAAIRRWKRIEWPRLKNAAAEGRTLVFIDESGLSERPHRVRTWAPRGQTPVFQLAFNWKRLSVIAGVTVWTFYFRLYPGTIKTPHIVDFLRHLCRQFRRKLLLIWDGLKAHRSRRVHQHVEASAEALRLAFLPAYALELNPAEYVWGSCKQHEVASFCPDEVAHLGHVARR